MKKIFAISLIAITFTTIFCGCGRHKVSYPNGDVDTYTIKNEHLIIDVPENDEEYIKVKVLFKQEFREKMKKSTAYNSWKKEQKGNYSETDYAVWLFLHLRLYIAFNPNVHSLSGLRYSSNEIWVDDDGTIHVYYFYYTQNRYGAEDSHITSLVVDASQNVHVAVNS